MCFLYVGPEVCPRVSTFPESSFLQIPSRDGHPCFRLYPSHYRADSGLSPVRNVRRRAHNERKRVLQHLQHPVCISETDYHPIVSEDIKQDLFPVFCIFSCGKLLFLRIVFLREQTVRLMDRADILAVLLPLPSDISDHLTAVLGGFL